MGIQETRNRIREEIKKDGDIHWLDFLDANNLAVNRREWLRPEKKQDYFLFLRLTDSLREKLGVVGDELLAVVLHQRTQQAWFFGEVRHLLKAKERLTKTAVLVLSTDAQVAELCQRAFRDSATQYKTAFVGISLDDVSTGAYEKIFWRAIRGQAFSVDHFDARTPVPDDMFGREAISRQIEHDVQQASAGVAILGVRRAGKTSLLKRSLSQVSTSDERWVVSAYDAQNDTVDASSDLAFRSLIRGLRKAAKQRGLELRSTATEPKDQLRWFVDTLVEDHALKVILAIDEVEWLVPTAEQGSEDAAREKAEDYIRLFGRLRALKQAHEDNLSLVVCGINESFCERGEYFEYPNPSLDLFKRHYASMLPPETLDAMLCTLGARMGIMFSGEALGQIYEKFGGHAYLARQFCSEMCKDRERPLTVAAGDVAAVYESYMSTRASAVLNSVMQTLARFYPDEYETLRAVAQGRKAGLGQADHLRAYGLVRDDGTVAFDAMARYASSHETDSVRAVRYQRLGRLGQGEFGVVWKCFDRREQRVVAVKEYAGARASEVAKAEWEVLQEIRSSAIPTPYELTELDGNPAVVMEFIEGETLERFLNGEPADCDSVDRLVRGICQAVDTLHPSAERKRSLQQAFNTKTSISTGDIHDFLFASEAGFLHRDLKPANVMLQAGATPEIRLVDVQLSKRTDRANLTLAGSPAYLPPDVGSVAWNTTFDLYAIAVIAHELVLGCRPVKADVQRWVSLVPNEALRAELSSFFDAGLAASSSERPDSVGALLELWDGVVTSVGWCDEALSDARATVALQIEAPPISHPTPGP